MFTITDNTACVWVIEYHRYEMNMFSSAGLTVLNKSKWKGGTLQIETAKESFLHRYSHLTVKVITEFNINRNLTMELEELGAIIFIII